MAIVEMSKFTLFVLSENREALLQELQRFKYVHFLNLKENGTLKREWGVEEIKADDALATIEEELNKIMFSIHVLEKYAKGETRFQAFKNGAPSMDFGELEEKGRTIDFHSIYQQVRDLVSQKEYIFHKRNRLKGKIEELAPWIPLPVPLPFIFSLETCEVNMGTIPKRLREKVEKDLSDTRYTYYTVIGEDKDFAYILAISHRSEIERVHDLLTANGFSRVKLDGQGTPEEIVAQLEKEMAEEQSRLKTVEEKLEGMTKDLPDLEIMYEYLMLKKMRISASEKYLRTEHFNIIEGYIPTKLAQPFDQVINKKLGDDYYLEIEEAGENDPNVPILLDNSKFARPFESLTAMYALPKYGEIDPTPLFSIFYVWFFGMMVADIGYGLIMLAGTYSALKFLKLTSPQKNVLRFFYYLSFSTILWGGIYGSFFGDLIPLPALVRPEEQYHLLLVLSIAFGIIHIFFALGVRGYMAIKKGKPLDALFDAGFWYLALGGGVAFVASMFMSVPPFVEKIGLPAMIIGLIGILFTGGRNSKTIGGKIGGGLYSLYGISGYVGDFVSYSRLMALGLSSAFIASAINMMARMLFEMGIFGWLFAIIVFVVGQSFNIFLSLLGSYVHTIRLTYVEFFGKFYEGGGQAFQPFRSEPKYIHIK